MTIEERNTLFNEICELIPYGTLLQDMEYNLRPVPGGIFDNWCKEIKLFGDEQYRPVEYIRPYLRRMSSMTDEEDKEFALLQTDFYVDGFLYPIASINMIKWLNEHHFDYKGLIDKGLALEAPEDMYTE